MDTLMPDGDYGSVDPYWKEKKLFPGFELNTQIFLTKFNEFLNVVIVSNSQYEFQVYMFCVIINIFHVIVLSRKQMRTSSTNVVMIGLAACEIYIFIDKHRQFFMDSFKVFNYNCYIKSTYFKLCYQIFTICAMDFFHMNTLWLGMSLAVIRTISVKNAMNPRFSIMSTSLFGWYTILLICSISFIISLMGWFCFNIVNGLVELPPDLGCRKKDSRMLIFETNRFHPIYLAMTAVLGRIIPSIAFPILTILLIFDLKKASATRKRVSNSKEADKGDRTSKIITYIAVSFMIAELPSGLLSLASLHKYAKIIGIEDLIKELDIIFSGVSIFNTATRWLVCYAMSSQYRETAKNLFGCNEKKIIRESDPESEFKQFTGFDKKTQLKLVYFLDDLNDFIEFTSTYNYQIYLFCAIINIFHVIVLSRKQMRTSSTNVVMIGLAACEVYIFMDKYRAYFMDNFGFHNVTCFTPSTYIKICYDVFTICAMDFFHMNTLWLGMSLAVIRTISVKNAMDPRFGIMSNAIFGWYTIILICSISSIFGFFCWFCYDITYQMKEWAVDMGCSKPKEKILIYQINGLYVAYNLIVGVLGRIIPSIAFPILTILLIFDLKKASATRKRVSNSKEADKGDRTSKIITYIAVSFMIAELPKGIFSVIYLHPLAQSKGMLSIMAGFESIFTGVSVFNTATRWLVCYAMSSQYRETAKTLFGCVERKDFNNPMELTKRSISTTKT